MLIVMAFKDLSESAASIARRFHTSDTHVMDVFDRYVKLERLPLSDIISLDEVHMDLDPNCKYALVIQDFYTGDPIDILRSRRSNVTEPYFAAIPIEERRKVRYLLSDMYNPYITFASKYFPNAVSVVDSFHVVLWVTHSIDNYIRALIKRYRQQEREDESQPDSVNGISMSSISLSDKIYMLQKYRWLVLANQYNIIYRSELRMDYQLRAMMNTYDYESLLFRIEPRLKDLRDLKEMYVRFNSRNAGMPIAAEAELDELIEYYANCGDGIFVEFARLLSKYREPIINSFIMVEKHGNGEIYDSRLSNGPIESLNRKVKDMKRLGRGYRNFEHFRNRFLYATRSNPILSSYPEAGRVQYFEDDDF